jgi:DNA-binding transcriptional ArsR family regulator
MIEMDVMALAKSVEHRDMVDVDRMAESAREATEFLKALAHESRLLILCDLLDGEKSVGELESFLDLRQSTVSQQLARLRLEGLVSARRDGKTIYYSIANERVRAVIGVLYSTFCNVKPARAAKKGAGDLSGTPSSKPLDPTLLTRERSRTE